VLLAPDRDGALNADLATVGGELKLMLPGEPRIALVPLDLAQRLLRMEGRASELAIAVQDLERVDEVAKALRAAVGPELEVHTWAQVSPERSSELSRQDFMVGLVSTVFLILMLLGVANTVLMSVLERTREIGTLMAVGVRRGQVLILVLLESIAVGMLGGAAGLAVGAAATAALAARGIPLTPPEASVELLIVPYLTPSYALGVAFTALAGAALFSLYPAWRASRLRPVEALAGR
jgi:putative ABC transport system permease protein